MSLLGCGLALLCRAVFKIHTLLQLIWPSENVIGANRYVHFSPPVIYLVTLLTHGLHFISKQLLVVFFYMKYIPMQSVLPRTKKAVLALAAQMPRPHCINISNFYLRKWLGQSQPLSSAILSPIPINPLSIWFFNLWPQGCEKVKGKISNRKCISGPLLTLPL